MGHHFYTEFKHVVIWSSVSKGVFSLGRGQNVVMYIKTIQLVKGSTRYATAGFPLISTCLKLVLPIQMKGL